MAPDVAQPYDDLDDFNLEGLEDDPFRSPSPQPDKGKDTSKKRKTDGLGIDEEVDVNKRARVPRVKLDESRLLSEDGIPKLRARAGKLKLKGKGHEFSDAARLLSFYQYWLDDLFPKAKFLDALAMVEKAGHKRVLTSKRAAWIDEGKPRSSVMADDEDIPSEMEAEASAASAVPAGDARPKTPVPATTTTTTVADDVPDDDDDIYGATPIRTKPVSVPIRSAMEPDDDDDLDALMAEAEADSRRAPIQNGKPGPSNAPEEDDDDLDALMAEADADMQRNSNGAQSKTAEKASAPQDDFADDEAAMAEMGGLW
ncbi:replication fork protection component Swi3 [Plectosphaerella plurivora]|uniref:Chromosome segregation in meiosis protein n=1 Tax=Plectosphaerella plurivora TaxID=936078 RepID=A0A9P9A9H1_9PEZI|nr:replication fork protection component Swi3 [Plectosphaerella plurivora]